MKVRLSVGTTIELGGKYYKTTADIEDDISIIVEGTTLTDINEKDVKNKFEDMSNLLSEVVISALANISDAVEEALE